VKVAAVVAVVPLVEGRGVVLGCERDPPGKVHDAASALRHPQSEKQSRRVTLDPLREGSLQATDQNTSVQ
jgi:nitrogen fixation protein FixH